MEFIRDEIVVYVRYKNIRRCKSLHVLGIKICVRIIKDILDHSSDNRGSERLRTSSYIVQH